MPDKAKHGCPVSVVGVPPWEIFDRVEVLPTLGVGRLR